MAYIGRKPTNAPLTSSDIADGIISTADLANTAVTGAKVNTDVISAQTALATEPADTDEFLVSDAGVIKRIDYSLIKGGGSLVLLSTATISSGVSEVDITSNIDSTYKNYIVEITNMHVATNDQEFRMRLFQGGSVDTGSVYDYGFQRVQSNNNNVYTSSSNVAQIQLNAATSNASDAGLNGRFYIANPASTTFNTHVKYDLNYQIDGDNVAMIDGIARIEETAAVDGVRFYMGSGNIDAGIFKLYGVA